jgi:hypothetical protein
LLQTGLSATETTVLAQIAYGNEALKRSKFLGGVFDFKTEGSW